MEYAVYVTARGGNRRDVTYAPTLEEACEVGNARVHRSAERAEIFHGSRLVSWRTPDVAWQALGVSSPACSPSSSTVSPPIASPG